MNIPCFLHFIFWLVIYTKRLTLSLFVTWFMIDCHRFGAGNVSYECCTVWWKKLDLYVGAIRPIIGWTRTRHVGWLYLRWSLFEIPQGLQPGWRLNCILLRPSVEGLEVGRDRTRRPEYIWHPIQAGWSGSDYANNSDLQGPVKGSSRCN
jgi:hypothetical protein